MNLKEENNEIQIFKSVNDYEANQVCAILKENGIPYIKKSMVVVLI